ncbi:MAG: hypothetical protein H7Z38_19210 [Rubrivivax sp.]|nr:hypothetical protein [Pyrinomonadaceae bacterium]
MMTTRSKADSLLGRWLQVATEDETVPGEIMTLTFTGDGKLVYCARKDGVAQIINLVYEVAGDTIISDQPSEPRIDHTKFWFETDDSLVLEYDGIPTWFRREQ